MPSRRTQRNSGWALVNSLGQPQPWSSSLIVAQAWIFRPISWPYLIAAARLSNCAVVDCAELLEDFGGALGRERRELLANGEVGVVLRCEEVVGLGFVAGAEQLARVGGRRRRRRRASRRATSRGLAGVEHVADAGLAPRWSAGFEHPVGVRERGGEREVRGITWWLC